MLLISLVALTSIGANSDGEPNLTEAGPRVPSVSLEAAPAVYNRFSSNSRDSLAIPGLNLRAAKHWSSAFSTGISGDLASQLGCGDAGCSTVANVGVGARYLMFLANGLGIFFEGEIGYGKVAGTLDEGNFSSSGPTTKIGFGLSQRLHPFQNIKIALSVHYLHLFSLESAANSPSWDFVQFALPIQMLF